MGYVIALCIVVLAAFVCTAVVLVRDGGEREARVFTELEPEQQQMLYNTPIEYEDESHQSWRQKGIVCNVTPRDDDTADVEVMWYNAKPDETTRKKETNIERIAAKKKDVQAKGMHKGGVVTIRVQPGQGVTVVAA